jgi:recombination protein RecR
MISSFNVLQKILRRIPGIGYRSAERIALFLLLEGKEHAEALQTALHEALETVKICTQCGNLSESELCSLCCDMTRDRSLLCVVETIPDLHAIERTGNFHGQYQVLNGKLSPIRGIFPQHLPFEHLHLRLQQEEVQEVILALGNDIESEATCQYILKEILQPLGKNATRIGFGLPAGGGIAMSDTDTLHTAILSRRKL